MMNALDNDSVGQSVGLSKVVEDALNSSDKALEEEIIQPFEDKNMCQYLLDW